MDFSKNRKELSQESVYWSLCFHLYCKRNLHTSKDGSKREKRVTLIQLWKICGFVRR